MKYEVHCIIDLMSALDRQVMAFHRIVNRLDSKEIASTHVSILSLNSDFIKYQSTIFSTILNMGYSSLSDSEQEFHLCPSSISIIDPSQACNTEEELWESIKRWQGTFFDMVGVWKMLICTHLSLKKKQGQNYTL